MGLIYVNPEGPNGNPDPLAAARDIRETFAPHGDERRGDRGADRRRPHVRQDATAPATADHVGPEPEGAPDRAAGPRLEEHATAPARAATRITSGLEGAWTNEPTKWDNGFLENLFGYEWELTKSPAGAKQWTPEGPRGAGHRARRPRPVEAARADDADDRPRAADGPDLRADLQALPREPGPSSPTRSPRPGTSCCTATWGRSRATSARGSPSRSSGRTRCPPVDHELIDDADIAALKEQDPRVGPVRLAARLHGLGVGRQLPRHRQARRRQRRPHPPGAAEGLGGQRAGRAGQGAAGPRADPAGVQRRSPAARRSRSPT